MLANSARLGRFNSPAGIDEDNELFPQGGVTHGQVDLPEGPLMVPDGPAASKKQQRQLRWFDLLHLRVLCDCTTETGAWSWLAEGSRRFQPLEGRGGRTYSGYWAPSEMSKRDEAMEFSDSRLCESNRRMFDVEGAKRPFSPATKEPRRWAGRSPP